MTPFHPPLAAKPNDGRSDTDRLRSNDTTSISRGSFVPSGLLTSEARAIVGIFS